MAELPGRDPGSLVDPKTHELRALRHSSKEGYFTRGKALVTFPIALRSVDGGKPRAIA
jgi:hypothetical protein